MARTFIRLSLVLLKKWFWAFCLVNVPLSGVSVPHSSVRVGGRLETLARLTSDSSSSSSALSGSGFHTRIGEPANLGCEGSRCAVD